MKRNMSVAGSFYPNEVLEIQRYFKHFNFIIDKNRLNISQSSKIVIVPHAGYIYSGFTANLAYKVLQNSSVKNFVVIGPSHRVSFDGVSLCEFTSYETPFGDIKSSATLAKELKDEFSLSCLSNAHYEHSTEVQFPFLKHYIEDVSIVELVYGKADPKEISKIIDFVLAKEDYGVVISTDLSHFYDLDTAQKLDSICLESLKNLDTKHLHEGCEACGMLGVEAMMLSAKKLNLDFHPLDYRTSADASEDTNRVVGYLSGYFKEVAI